MQRVVRSTIICMGLLAGVAFGAYAQTDNVAALPPGAQAPTPPAAVVAPSGKYVGPALGETWSAQERQTQPVRPSSEAYVGPALGSTWTAQETQTQPVAPSPEYVGPRPN
jgi:hypothetical protein